MNTSTTLRATAALAALFLLAGSAQAQFVWIDANGVKQISDQTPPSSVPRNMILKAPRPMKAMTAEEIAAKAASPAKDAAPSIVDREADYRKRQKEKAEVDKKAAAVESRDAQRSAACDAARVRSAELASGKRLRSDTGDGTILDDAGRAAAQASTNQSLANCN